MANQSVLAIKRSDGFKAIQSDEEHSLISKPNVPIAIANKKKKKKKKKRKVSCWSIITNFKFLFFMINCFIVIGIFVWWFMVRPNTQIPYIIAGIIGIIIAITGYRTFNQLMALTKEANVFEKNNKNMKKEHHWIKNEVNNISIANKDLRSTELRLRAANKKNRQNLTNFREVQTFMQQMNIEDFKVVTTKATNIGQKWHDELLQQERNMLHLIFDRYEMNHEDKDGMSFHEFEKFAACLPDAYQKRFARLGTFEKLSNNKGVLEYADFEIVLDVFAEMIVDDVDIELQLVKNEIDEEKTPETELIGNPSTISNISTNDGNDSDDDGGDGFLNRLSTWRKTKKHRDNRSERKLILKGKTPTTQRNKSNLFGTLGNALGNTLSDMFDVGGKNQQEKDKTVSLSPRIEEQEEEEQDNDRKEDDGNNKKKVLNKPETTKRTISAIELKHEADESLDDDDINHYMETMKKQERASSAMVDIAGMINNDEHP